MKKTRVKNYIGKGKALIAMIVAMMLIAGFAIPSFAIDDGDSVTYRASHAGDGAGTVAKFTIVGDSSYSGCCAEQGVDVTTGTELRGTVGRIANTTKAAKLMYQYAVVEDWWSGPDAEDVDVAKDALRPFGSQYVYISITPRRLVEAIAQISNQGKSSWKNAITSGAGSWPDWEADLVTDWYDSLDASGVTVPNGFELYFLSPNGNDEQPAYVWRMAQTGDLTVEKVTQGVGDIASQSFTFKITVDGASGEYSGVTFNSSGVATITLRGGQSKKIEGLPGNASYSVVEQNIPDGWSLKSKSNDSGTIESGSNMTATFTNEKEPGKVNLKKQSALPLITN